MFPGAVDMVAGIVPAGIVPDPLVSLVDMRRFGMPGLVREVTLWPAAALLRSARRAALLRAIGRLRIAALLWAIGLLRIAAKRLWTARGRRAGVITALRLSVAFCPTPPFLSQAGNRAQKNY